MASDGIITFPNVGGLEVLALLQAELANCVVSLFQENITPSKNSVKADYEAAECDFSGYTTKTVAAFNDPAIDGNNDAIMLSPQTTWTQTADTITNTVYGGWVENAAGDLMFAFKFTTPRLMLAADNYLAVTLGVRNGGGFASYET